MNTAFNNKAFEPVEEGEYLVAMNQMPKEQNTKAGDLKLNCGFKILSGDSEGRLLFADFLIGHSKDNVRKIAEDKVNNLLQAAGIRGGLEEIGSDYSQLEQILHAPFIARVKIEAEREYTDAEGVVKTVKPRNKITSFKSR